MDMIDLFTKMLSEIALWKTNNNLFSVLFHATKAAWIKQKIVKMMNNKESLDSSDVYNCIFIINHAERKVINFLNASFETYISSAGASFHYVSLNNNEDIFISIHKNPNKKEFSRIDVDTIMDTNTKHYTVDGLKQEGWPATVLLVVLEIVLRRLYIGSEFDD